MIKPLVLDSKRKEEGVSPSSSRLSAMSAPLTPPTCAKPLTPPTCAKPSRGYITERKVQARGAADVTD